MRVLLAVWRSGQAVLILPLGCHKRELGTQVLIHTSTGTGTGVVVPCPAEDCIIASKQCAKHANRETSVKGEASLVLEMSPDSIQKEARILCLASEDDDANAPLTESRLPFGSSLLQVGTQPSDFDDSLVDDHPNVLFVS